jgi:hypothetical protein
MVHYHATTQQLHAMGAAGLSPEQAVRAVLDDMMRKVN